MFQHVPRLLDLAEEVLRARDGDTEARSRVLRQGLPMAADLVEPGAGAVITRGLQILDRARGAAPREHLVEGQYREVTVRPDLPDYTTFARRLVRQPCGLYVAVGEPGTGKTTLALRLAQRIAEELGYSVHAVGGLHPDDRARWHTDDWLELEAPDAFARGMQLIADAMVGEVEPATLRTLQRRVLLLDDASLTASIGQVKANRALMQAWNTYRHVSWVIILTARVFKSVTTLAGNADIRFLKRPTRDVLEGHGEREEALAWWRAAERAYAGLRGTADWQAHPREQQWVYAQAPRLGFEGLVQYDPPGAPAGRLRDAEGPPVGAG